MWLVVCKDANGMTLDRQVVGSCSKARMVAKRMLKKKGERCLITSLGARKVTCTVKGEQ